MFTVLKMFFSPSRAFNSLKEREKINIWFPFIVLLLIMTAYMAVFRGTVPYQQRMKAVIELQEARGIDIPEDVKKEVLERRESVYIVLFSYLSLPIVTLVMFFLVSIFIQFLSYFVSGKIVTVKEALSISFYGSLPPLFTTFSIIIIMMLLMPEKVNPIRPDWTFAANLSILVDAVKNKLAYDLLYTVDFFQIWRSILIVIGINVIGEMEEGKKSRSFILGIGVFLVFAILQFILVQLTT